MTKKEIAEHVFARNPKLKEVFITQDDKAFYEEHQADAHAERLNDRNVEKFTRGEKKSKTIEPADLGDSLKDTKSAVGGSPKGSKDEKKEDNGDTVLKDMKNAELKELATSLEIDLKGLNSNKKLIAAIETKRALQEAKAAKDLEVNDPKGADQE